MLDNYLLLFIDEKWGHNDDYYPVTYQFEVEDHNLDQMIQHVAKAIYDNRYDDGTDNDVIELFGLATTALPEEERQYTLQEIHDLLGAQAKTVHELVKWINGQEWHCGAIALIRDNDRVYNALIKAGMPIIC